MLEERERGYEAKWAHDEERHFKVMARRNDLLGRWAAGEMGLRDVQADDYAMAVIHIGLVNTGADPVFEKIRNDFSARKVVRSDRAIHQKMEDFFHRASDEVAG
jgi:hypothetical protein